MSEIQEHASIQVALDMHKFVTETWLSLYSELRVKGAPQGRIGSMKNVKAVEKSVKRDDGTHALPVAYLAINDKGRVVGTYEPWDTLNIHFAATPSMIAWTAKELTRRARAVDPKAPEVTFADKYEWAQYFTNTALVLYDAAAKEQKVATAPSETGALEGLLKSESAQ